MAYKEDITDEALKASADALHFDHVNLVGLKAMKEAAVAKRKAMELEKVET